MKIAFKTVLFTLIVLLMSFSVVAIPTINLRGPSNGSTTENYRLEFAYGFSAVPSDITECSLYINSVEVAKRQNLFSYDNNKISAELEAGSHDWFISCSDSSGAEVSSETRTVTMIAQVASEDGFETIYSNTGARIHVVSITKGMDSVEIPTMKSSDSIRIRTAKTTYDFDLIKMSALDGKSFIELRDRKSGKLQKIFVGESFTVDLDSNDEMDVSFELISITRGVDAEIIVHPFPNSEPAVSEETPVEEEIIPEETTDTTTETSTSEEGSDEEETPVNDPITTPEETTDVEVVVTESKSTNMTLPLIILALIVLAAIAGYFMMKKKPASKKAQPAKKEVKESPKSNTVEKKAEAPKESPKHTPASSAKSIDSFDVIKSTTSAKRK